MVEYKSGLVPLCGGVAQLGERTVRIRKVESSILFVSTKIPFTKVGGIFIFQYSIFINFSFPSCVTTVFKKFYLG